MDGRLLSPIVFLSVLSNDVFAPYANGWCTCRYFSERPRGAFSHQDHQAGRNEAGKRIDLSGPACRSLLAASRKVFKRHPNNKRNPGIDDKKELLPRRREMAGDHFFNLRKTLSRPKICLDKVIPRVWGSPCSVYPGEAKSFAGRPPPPCKRLRGCVISVQRRRRFL